MKCKRCDEEFNSKSKFNFYCKKCNEILWHEWEIEHSNELIKIKEIQKQGHTHHCACRQVWGDGECECDLYAQGYDPYAWLKSAIKANKNLTDKQKEEIIKKINDDNSIPLKSQVDLSDYEY